MDFNASYEGHPPWDIGRPQRSFEQLADAGAFQGSVLDVGCGTGEHALIAAARGLEATGIDASAKAIDLAKSKAASRLLDVDFHVWDALDLGAFGETFDTVLDSGLFHVFDDDARARYVESLRAAINTGGRYFMLCFSDRVPGGLGPRRVSQDEIRAAFANGVADRVHRRCHDRSHVHARRGQCMAFGHRARVNLTRASVHSEGSFGGQSAIGVCFARDGSPSRVGRRKRQQMDLRIELILIPVSDVDTAKAFYTEKLGFRMDVDHRTGDEFRVVQLTPPGSDCSMAIGVGITDAAPGSTRGTHLIVSDIVAARDELVGRGVEVGEVRHMGEAGWQPGPHPEHSDYTSFADFCDPDGNTWVLQEVDRSASGE